MLGLTVKQARFVDAIARDDAISITKAALSAGYSEASARTSGSDNMQNAAVLKAIEERKAQLAAAAGLTPELVLREWLAIATADPSELVSVLAFCCADCWEMDDSHLPVNPDCKRCKGLGVRLVSVADTRSLSPAARRLYAGAKQTKDGIEIKMRDQDGALAKIADYLGMLNKSKGEISGPGGGPVQLQAARPEDLSDDQLAAIAAAGVATLGVSGGVSSLALPAGQTIQGDLRADWTP